MRLLKSLVIALSTYSRIPMPNVDYSKENMKYSICFFPVIGLIIGLLLYLWYIACDFFLVGNILFAAVATILPIIVTGGIHMDGFCDTVDALNSYQPTEKKLAILKDPNAGAFAVIRCVMYFLLYFALFTEIDNSKALIIVCLGFGLSRACSGMSIVCFKNARTSGLASSFSDAAHKNIVKITMVCYIGILCIGMIFISLWSGIGAIIAAGLVFIYYYKMSYKQFGGITGDIAGYFLQICEIAILILVVITQR